MLPLTPFLCSLLTTLPVLPVLRPYFYAQDVYIFVLIMFSSIYPYS